VLVVSAYVLSFFHRMAPAAVAADLQQAFQTSGVVLGWLAASYFWVYTVMQIPTGVLIDTFGVRKIVVFGGLLAGVGSIVFGSATSLGVGIVGRLLVGLGVSFMFLSILKINSQWFRERHFGSMAGFTVLLGNLGAMASAAPLVWLLGYTTWREVFIAVGGVSLGLAVLSWFLIRDHPAQMGLPSLRELEGLAPHPPHRGGWRHGLIEVLRNRDTWPGFWPALGVAGGMLAFAGLWGVPYLTDVHGMTRAEAALHTTCLLGGFALGAFSVGTLSDRLGRRLPVLLAGCALYLVCWSPMLAGATLSAPWGYLLFTFMGLGAAGFTLVWAVAKEVNRAAYSGMATGVVNTGVFLGAALLQPLFGWVLDLGWDGRMYDGVRVYSSENYLPALWLLFGAGVAGLGGALGLRETRCRQVG